MLAGIKEQGFVGLVLSVISSPLVTPSPSQSSANQPLLGVRVMLIANNEHASIPLVPD